MSSTMIEFESAYLRDDRAKRKEPFQAPYDFLYTGKTPAVGQRTETQLTTNNGSWCMLSGIVTEVGEEPTFDMWITTSTLAPPPVVCGCSPDPYGMARPDVIVGFHEHCPYPDCTMCLLRKGDTEMSLGTMMERTREYFGALHNQTVTAFAYLNFDYFHREDRLPVKSSRIYKIVHKCDDGKNNIWCVESIQDVTDLLPPSELPQVFKDWEIGRENAGNVAPFDLSDLDRKVWHLQNEVEFARKKEEDDIRVAKLAAEHEGDDEDFYPEEHARFCGPYSARSAIFFFARETFPATRHGDADDADDADTTPPPPPPPTGTALKELLRQAVTQFESLSAKDRKVWDDKAAEDLQRYKQEKEEFGGDY